MEVIITGKTGTDRLSNIVVTTLCVIATPTLNTVNDVLYSRCEVVIVNIDKVGN